MTGCPCCSLLQNDYDEFPHYSTIIRLKIVWLVSMVKSHLMVHPPKYPHLPGVAPNQKQALQPGLPLQVVAGPPPSQEAGNRSQSWGLNPGTRRGDAASSWRPVVCFKFGWTLPSLPACVNRTSSSQVWGCLVSYMFLSTWRYQSF